MSAAIVKSSEFTAENIKYSSIKVNAQGGKQLNINYVSKDGQQALVLQTPKLVCPMGLSKLEEKDKDGKVVKTNYSISLSLAGFDSDPKVKKFYEQLSQIDEKIVGDAVKNSMEWLKMKSGSVTGQSLKDLKLFTPTIKLSLNKETQEPDGKYPPSIRMKVPQRDGKFNVATFNVEGDEVDMEYLQRGSKVTVLMQCASIWIVNGKFGVTWRPLQVKIEPPSRIGKSFAFIEDSDDEGEEQSEPQASGSSSSPGLEEIVVESSSSEGEEEQQEIETPPPVVEKPVVSAKVRVRKN